MFRAEQSRREIERDSSSRIQKYIPESGNTDKGASQVPRQRQAVEYSESSEEDPLIATAYARLVKGEAKLSQGRERDRINNENRHIGIEYKKKEQVVHA